MNNRFRIEFEAGIDKDELAGVGFWLVLKQVKRTTGKYETKRWRRIASDVEGVVLNWPDGSCRSCAHVRGSMEWRWAIESSSADAVESALKQVQVQLGENRNIGLVDRFGLKPNRWLPRRSILRRDDFKSVKDVRRAFRDGLIGETRAVRRLIGLRIPGMVVELKSGAFNAIRQYVSIRPSKRDTMRPPPLGPAS
jgi:hypothetical protein